MIIFNMSKHHYTYLALGDSYTIGESVALHENFPYQTVQLLRERGLAFHAPEIIAKTGWTSFELAEQLLHTRLQDQYDFVSLLIGVNNQYRHLPVGDFATDFAFLLKKAIHLAGNKPERVIVLSIPDWGVTPFAAKSGRNNISSDIDKFNSICESASKNQAVHFIDITNESRKAASDASLLAGDLLHYSGKAYGLWAEKISGCIISSL
jgi:lysophospholipase L1-like esterase